MPAYMNFAKGSGNVGHSESVLLVHNAYERNRGTENHNSKSIYSVFGNRLLLRHKNTAVSRFLKSE
jgi:hypothetical protein